MTLSNIIKLKTNDGLDVIDFLVEVMHDCYEDFQICHRLQAAKLLTTYGNEDAPNFIDDNPREPSSNRNGRKPKRPTKFDTELARIIRSDTRDGRSVAYFLIEVMQGGRRDFKPHHRMSAARELLDRGFGKSARKEKTTHPNPTEGSLSEDTPSPGGEGRGESLPRTRSGGENPAHTQHTPSPGGEGWGEGEIPAHHHVTTQPNPTEAPPLTPHSSPLTPQHTQLTNNIRHTLPYLHPDDFDDIIDDFLEEIGDVRSNYLEYNGDEVTEGVIDLDHVGLDSIHFRAKLSIDLIDELEIRDFSESLDRRGAATGMFITTSDFTDVARHTAETITAENRPIRLVDGTELARYLASIKMERKTASAHKPEENHPNQHT